MKGKTFSAIKGNPKPVATPYPIPQRIARRKRCHTSLRMLKYGRNRFMKRKDSMDLVHITSMKTMSKCRFLSNPLSVKI
jgi:hypothetical protein